MISRAVARRYARGLLEATVEVAEPGDEETLSSQLETVTKVIEGHAGLHLLTVNPAIRWEKKAVILDELASKLALHPLLQRFLKLLAEKERLDHLASISSLYTQLVDEHRGVVTAEVATPIALQVQGVQALQDRVSEVTGRKIRLTAQVVPSLLGGLVMRIGDVVYDGSLRSHLARIRKRLASA
ncbi:MAG: ATP synthase F1 subunit delta [Acidobacteriota bacterium]